MTDRMTNELIQRLRTCDPNDVELVTQLLGAAADALERRDVEPSEKPVRVCPDSEDGNHVLKQDGPFSIVYCDACGMNRGWRTQERDDPLDGVRWVCGHCTTVNGISDVACLGCKRPRCAVERSSMNR